MRRAEELYVGYARSAPEATARFLRPRVALLAATAVCVAALLAVAQRPFDEGRFGYGEEIELEGVLLETPYPMLAVADDGAVAMSLLVLSGKHGAGLAVAGLDGRRVRLRGAPIERGGRAMLELAEHGVEDRGPGGTRPRPVSLGPVSLTGEIVDSKCFLGVMKPSREAPHRGCARNCVAGGIPPALWVPTPGGEVLLLLVDRRGEAMGTEVLPWVARPVEVRGTVSRIGDLLLLSVETYRAAEAT